MFFQNTKRVLFVGAHTDDEIICAGSLKRLVNQGAEVHVIVFSSAGTINDPKSQGTASSTVFPEFWKSMDILNVKREHVILADWGCDDLPERAGEIRQAVYNYVTKHAFDLIFALSPHDDHQSHQVVGMETERVLKGRAATILRCQYPWNYRAFNPNVFVTLSIDECQAKLDCVAAYQSQAFRYNYGAMFEHYAKGDGLSIKRDLAEKFELVRTVI